MLRTVLTSVLLASASALRVGVGVSTKPPPFVRSPSPLAFATATATTAATAIEYGGIPSVRVLVGDASAALKYYTEVLGMVAEPSAPLDAPGACVRIGAQVIELVELPNPDPVGVDPSYNMSAPPPGYVAEGRPVHAGRDRHVAITLDALAPLKASLEAAGVPYTMSFSGRQALFCRDEYGNGWEFGPPTTYENATRLFPPYLRADDPATASPILRWGGIPHVGILVSDNEKARDFYCGVLGMVDENDLRPTKLPFPGLFLRCGEQQVHILELPNPDPDAAADRPGAGKDRCTAYTVKDLGPVRAALDAAGIAHEDLTRADGAKALSCRDPDANEQIFVEDKEIQPIMEAKTGPMVPWTRLW